MDGRPAAASVRADAVVPEVGQVHGPQLFGDLAATRVGDVVDVRAHPLDVGFRIVELACHRLGGRQDGHQAPEEAGVEMATRSVDGEIVELARRELVETVVVAHRTIEGWMTEAYPSAAKHR